MKGGWFLIFRCPNCLSVLKDSEGWGRCFRTEAKHDPDLSKKTPEGMQRSLK